MGSLFRHAQLYHCCSGLAEGFWAQMLMQINHPSLGLGLASILQGHHRQASSLLCRSGQTWEEVTGTWSLQYEFVLV